MTLLRHEISYRTALMRAVDFIGQICYSSQSARFFILHVITQHDETKRTNCTFSKFFYYMWNTLERENECKAGWLWRHVPAFLSGTVATRQGHIQARRNGSTWNLGRQPQDCGERYIRYMTDDASETGTVTKKSEAYQETLSV